MFAGILTLIFDTDLTRIENLRTLDVLPLAVLAASDEKKVRTCDHRISPSKDFLKLLIKSRVDSVSRFEWLYNMQFYLDVSVVDPKDRLSIHMGVQSSVMDMKPLEFRIGLSKLLSQIDRILSAVSQQIQNIQQGLRAASVDPKADTLASKVAPFLAKTPQRQPQCNFGLRALKAVLTSAGHLKRAPLQAGDTCFTLLKAAKQKALSINQVCSDICESIITQQHKKDHSISPASAEWLGWNWSRYQETAKDSEEYRSNAGVMAEEQRKAHNEANLRDEQLMTSLASSAINLPSEKILYSRLATLNKDSFNSPVWKGRKSLISKAFASEMVNLKQQNILELNFDCSSTDLMTEDVTQVAKYNTFSQCKFQRRLLDRYADNAITLKPPHMKIELHPGYEEDAKLGHVIIVVLLAYNFASYDSLFSHDEYKFEKQYAARFCLTSITYACVCDSQGFKKPSDEAPLFKTIKDLNELLGIARKLISFALTTKELNDEGYRLADQAIPTANRTGSLSDWDQKLLDSFEKEGLAHFASDARHDFRRGIVAEQVLLLMIMRSNGLHTETWQVLFATLGSFEGHEGVSYVINPNEISKDSFYGTLDSTTRE
ncbi:hypothetical protein BY996DRAFT_6584894 [Phakopsora pachyrhizi]|nr:hypothetical protein BY996DRAFT_6584894 [Phakopsora pachyrhizi]